MQNPTLGRVETGGDFELLLILRLRVWHSGSSRQGQAGV